MAIYAIACILIGCSDSLSNHVRHEPRKSDDQPIEELVKAPVTVEEIKLALSRSYPPDIEYALNEVKRSRLSYDVCKLIACAYKNCMFFSSDWHPVVLESNLVRVNLLDVLSQAKSQGIDFSEGLDFRKDAIRFLEDESPFVVQRALLVLSHIGEETEVAVIGALAESTDSDTTFRVAIIALTRMPYESKEQEVRRVLSLSSESRRTLVGDLVKP